MTLLNSPGSWAVAAAACLSSIPAPSSAADGHVALFKSVTGQVHVLRQRASLQAAPGMQLFVDDELVSDAGANAAIVFQDGTMLTLGAASDIQLRDYVFDPGQAKYAFSVYLGKGSAIYSSGRIGKLSPGSVRVDTPTSTVGVRGTRFIIEAH
jgi:hypothetical protein